MNIPYPPNYFDPFEGDQRAQCTECGDWFEAGEIDNVNEVPCLERGAIYQGVCVGCVTVNQKPSAADPRKG